MNKKLTLKEKAFIKETIATKNPTEAARRVYNLGGKGGSKTKKQENWTASAIGRENLSKPRIKKKIEEYLPDDLIFGSLEEDIKNKPSYRRGELELAAKLRGLLSDKIDITSKGKTIEGFNFIRNKATESSVSNKTNKVK